MLALRAALLRAEVWHVPGPALGGAPLDLYHFPNEGSGFFVEVGVEHEQPLVLRSFVSSVPLEDYTHDVQLPEF